MAALDPIWTAGEIRAVNWKGEPYRIAGWLNGLFSLDVRPPHSRINCLPCGWVLSHLPTGYGILAVVGDFTTAALVAADVATWGDWAFEDHARVREFRGRLDPLMARFPDTIVTPDDFPLSPWMVVPRAQLQRFLAPAGLETTAEER